ncbi:hypothetical protein QCA50_001058 [Cerrena zonata]|uniref:Uncharacterized protein n=1 Tax=Cerrena zonata TaxID=2478898 RepID=A0AAW0GS36_9APHY
MNTVVNSTSPSPRKPRERERPLDQRESLLRASILDTALELGVGSGSTVANWIFNPVEEVDEDEDSMVSPSLTYASTATSEESSFSNSPFSRSQPGAGASPLGPYAGKALSPDGFEYSNGPLKARALTPEPPGNRTVQFDLSATPEPRKPRPDGYDSDGGYISDGSKPKKKDKKSKKKSKANGDETEYESDGGYMSESTSKKKKDKKRKKDKSKTSDHPGTDYESDTGYMSSRSLSFGRKKSSKKSSAPADGDDSDGGYLSETSKKKRFFRFRKKQSSDSPVPDVPPVPQLPMILPIADRFITREDSLDIMDAADYTRQTPTPAFSERTITDRASDEFSSSRESSFSMVLGSPKSLVNPFKDAESVRSPSIDVLATFHRRGILPGQYPGERSPGTSSPLSSNPTYAQSPSQSQTDHSPASSQSSFKFPSVPNLTIPKPKRNLSMKRTPPQISAPNTSALVAKHTPVPLTITPPTPVALSMLSDNHAFPSSSQSDRSSSPSPPLSSRTRDIKSPFSPDPASVQDREADVPHTPSAYTDNMSTAPSTPQLTRSSSPNPGNQGLTRPNVLAYYDLPPPSPPPSGPLPSLPRDASSNGPFARAQNATLPRNGSRPGTADSVPERATPSPLRRLPTTGNTTVPSSPYQSPPSRAVPNAPPMSARSQQSFMTNQRGRDAPFPTQPILPREEAAQLVRRTSRTGLRKPPMSADAANRNPSSFRPVGGLDVNWQPRSASAMDVRDPSQDARWEGRRSWSEYDDEHGAGGSRASGETSAEVDAVISMLRAHKKDLDGRGTPSASATGDNQDSRSTQYYDLSDNDDEEIRYSVWSDSKSRASILDDEKSEDVRQRFVKRVEAMYGKEIVPPVPQLSAPRSGMF